MLVIIIVLATNKMTIITYQKAPAIFAYLIQKKPISLTCFYLTQVASSMFINKTVQDKRLNTCVSELLRYELSKPIAKFFDGKYQLLMTFPNHMNSINRCGAKRGLQQCP